MAESGAMRDKSISQNDKSSQTHERLAAEYNVSPATITRDGQYAACRSVLRFLRLFLLSPSPTNTRQVATQERPINKPENK